MNQHHFSSAHFDKLAEVWLSKLEWEKLELYYVADKGQTILDTQPTGTITAFHNPKTGDYIDGIQVQFIPQV